MYCWARPTGEENQKFNLKKMKKQQKNRIFMIGGGRFLTPPDRQETNVSSWSHDGPCTVFMIGGGRFLTPPDRQAPTSYKKGSSRNKCFFMIGGGSFFDPPWSSRFCHKWYLHHFSDSGKLWKNACALVTGVSRKPLPFESSVQFFFPNGLHFFLKLVRWIILFFPLDFLKWACLLPVFFP